MNFYKRKDRKNFKRAMSAVISVITALCIMLSGYIALLYVDIPFITPLRNVWIETAMTTHSHQWLATGFFPKWLIDDILSNTVSTDGITSITQIQTPSKDEPVDILGQADLVVGGKDQLGNKVLVNDIEQGIVIVEVKGEQFVGKLLFVDDPSRIIVGSTNRKGVHGQLLCDLAKSYDAIAGVNASGFYDADGHGKGGQINGLCYSQGEVWGKRTKETSVCFDKNNRLIVGTLNDWDQATVRDGIQFNHPVLIADGVQLMKTNRYHGSGFGIQPRTVIAQRADGVVMLMVIDGRQVGYSVGAKLGECADILIEYGAVTAGACDGGSSSVMAYDGEIITVPSTPMKDTGRYLPNAFLVKKK